MLRCSRRPHHGSDKWDCAVTVQHVWGGAKASGGELRRSVVGFVGILQEKCPSAGEGCRHHLHARRVVHVEWPTCSGPAGVPVCVWLISAVQIAKMRQK